MTTHTVQPQHIAALPADIAAESATLGAILLNREAIIQIAAWLAPTAFYLEKHAWVYAAALACYDRGEPPDIRTVAAELIRRGQLDQVGDLPYLAELVDACPVPYHVEYYARTVERTAILRAIIVAGGRIAAIGYDLRQDSDAALAAAQAELDRIADRPDPDDGLQPLSTLIDQQYEAIARAAETGESIGRGVAVGLRDLDDLTGGLHGGDLVIVAARPSVGKSALASCWAYHVAGSGARVDLFSLEMSAEQLTQRLIAIDSGLDHGRIRLGQLRDYELPTYLTSLGRLAALPLYLDDRPAQRVADIRSRVLRNAARNGDPQLVIVDYLQLMAGTGRADNRVQEVSELSRGLKQLARELDVPIVALSQLNRAVEGRQSKVPMLSDLRESGAIEQDADIVLFIYREDMYQKDTENKGVAELHIAKHRNGRVGVIPCRFDGTTQRFQDLTYRLPDAPGYGVIERAWPNNE